MNDREKTELALGRLIVSVFVALVIGFLTGGIAGNAFMLGRPNAPEIGIYEIEYVSCTNKPYVLVTSRSWGSSNKTVYIDPRYLKLKKTCSNACRANAERLRVDSVQEDGACVWLPVVQSDTE